MEQVFGMVNQLLIKNSETRKRKLKMRTYKVRVLLNFGLNSRISCLTGVVFLVSIAFGAVFNRVS